MFAIAVQLHSLARTKESKEKALLCKYSSQQQNGKTLSITRTEISSTCYMLSKLLSNLSETNVKFSERVQLCFSLLRQEYIKVLSSMQLLAS